MNRMSMIAFLFDWTCHDLNQTTAFIQNSWSYKCVVIIHQQSTAHLTLVKALKGKCLEAFCRKCLNSWQCLPWWHALQLCGQASSLSWLLKHHLKQNYCSLSAVSVSFRLRRAWDLVHSVLLVFEDLSQCCFSHTFFVITLSSRKKLISES